MGLTVIRGTISGTLASDSLQESDRRKVIGIASKKNTSSVDMYISKVFHENGVMTNNKHLILHTVDL